MFRTISSTLPVSRLFVSHQLRCRTLSTIKTIATPAQSSHLIQRLVQIAPIATTHSRNYCIGEPIKKKKPKKQPPAVEHVGRLDFRVGKILEVNVAPDAASLYLTRIDIGGEVLNVVAGLVEKIPADQLTGHLAIILCNLKPTKLRGHVSEAMIMCAKSDGTTELLKPPSGSEAGDLVYCEGYERVPVEVPRDKKRLFDPLAEDLQTDASANACYKGACLYIPDKGTIKVASLKNAPIA